jgi:hypothetical protein
LPPTWCPAYRRRERGSGFGEERENLSSRCEGSSSSGEYRKSPSTDAGHRGRDARSRGEGAVMDLDRRGIIVQLKSGSGQLARGGAPDASAGAAHRAHLNVGSRMNREIHVRFWEGLGV